MRMRRAWLLLALLLLPNMAAAKSGETITIQLKWRHQFQFAGLYMAEARGYFREEGLNVALIEGGIGRSSIEHVLTGEGCYGIADTGVLLERAKGKPLVALAAIFQHSPLALMVREDAGIHSLADLRGKRIMIQPGRLNADILAMLAAAGIDESGFVRQEMSYNLDDLIERRTDAYAVYITDQPHLLDVVGIPYRLFRPKTFDIDFYGDLLITSEEEVRLHPQRVKRLIRAVQRGWLAALEQPEQAVVLILSRYNTQKLSKSQLDFEAEKTAQMIMKEIVQIGYMSPYRWERIAAVYAAAGLMPENFVQGNFVYEQELDPLKLIVRYRWQLAIVLLLVLLIGFSLHIGLLRRQVRQRTASLRESKERLRSLIENLPGIVYRAHPGTPRRFTFLGSEMSFPCAVPVDALLNGEVAIESLLHPEDRQRVEQAWNSKTLSLDLEYRLQLADGSVFWVAERGQAACDRLQRVRHIDGTLFCIDERKRAEALQADTAAILEQIAAGVPSDQILAAIVRMIESRHPGARVSILHLQKGRLMLGAAPSLPDEWNRLDDGTPIGPQVGSSGTSAWLGKRVIVPDIAASELWVPWQKAAERFGLRACWSEPVLDAVGKVCGTLAVYRDEVSYPAESELTDVATAVRLAAIVFERDRTLVALRQMQHAVEQTSESVLITDRFGAIEYVNPAFEKLTGYTAREALGNTPRLLKSDRQGAAFYAQMWRTIAGGESWSGRIVQRRKDGSLYPAVLAISPIRNENGVVDRYVGVHRDISELQQLEAQFMQAQKLEAVGTLAGGIAHDFNNMMAGITGNVFLARLDAKQLPSVMRRLESIEQTAMRAGEITHQLLTFARKGLVRRHPLPLRSLVTESLKLNCKVLPENIRLDLSICADLLPVVADAGQMQQVLLNLLSNARDAVQDTPNPVVRVRLGEFQADAAFLDRHPEIHSSRLAALSVADNGCGIAPGQLEHIFEPFFTTKPVGQGSGLGLAMVIGAVQSNDGVIEVNSRVGGGSEFTLFLPLHEDEIDSAKQLPPLVRGRGETILLADDDPLVRQAGAEAMAALGYNVISAENGAEALQQLQAHADRVDLALLDLVMPRLGGVEAAREMLRIRPELKLLFLTGYDRDALGSDLPQGVELLRKPLAIEVLSQTLRRELDRKGERR